MPTVARQSKRQRTADRALYVRVGGFVIVAVLGALRPETMGAMAGVYAMLVGADAYVGGKYIDGETARPSCEHEPEPPFYEGE